MSINKWPEQERPREKLITNGADFLSDAELLAIFLRTGTKGRSALDLARDLVKHFGSLRQLLSASIEEVCQFNGLGQSKFAQLQAAKELGQRSLHEQLYEKPLLNNHRQTEQYLLAKLRDLPYEVFYCLFLDNQNHLIASEELARGSHNSSRVYPREIIKRCLHHNASAVIFAHNHPSGHCKPSQADIQLTNALKDALLHIDVVVHDHLIVGESQALSMQQQGLM